MNDINSVVLEGKVFNFAIEMALLGEGYISARIKTTKTIKNEKLFRDVVSFIKVEMTKKDALSLAEGQQIRVLGRLETCPKSNELFVFATNIDIRGGKND